MLYQLISPKWPCWLLTAAMLLSASNSINAQESNQLSRSQLTAVLSVINFMITDETPGEEIDLILDKVSTKNYGYRFGQGNYKEGLTVNFERAAEDVVLCFHGVDVHSSEVRLELNNTVIGNLKSGENCFNFPVAQLQSNNVLKFIHTNPGERWGIKNISYSLTRDEWLTMPVSTRGEWDNVAVRKVLQIFAFGGHATDQQIQAWADMDPKIAIKEMLNFDPHNFKLSPLPAGEKYPEAASLSGTFWDFREFIGDINSSSPISREGDTSIFDRLKASGSGAQAAWVRMTLVRGLNPFRQKIGLWETNYHMAVNFDAGVQRRQMTYYYDLIMNAHEAGLPYEKVIAEAAKSAAVAAQYGHRVSTSAVKLTDDNRWVPRKIDVNNTPDNPWDDALDYDDMHCECNEDFAREIHQLFFGILGEQDPLGLQNHENVTIPETAKALTHMAVDYIPEEDVWSHIVDFRTEFHHSGTVNILNQTISGNNASEKIDGIVDVAIKHPESLQNLPIIIISGLADDQLNDQKKQQLRAAWASMPSKNFLEFIQAYAVSKLFHSPDRVKYTSTIDRMMYVGNKLVLNNTEALMDRYYIGLFWAGLKSIADEGIAVFEPLHNVFGNQTGIEASDSAATMENHYNRYTEFAHLQANAKCSSCDNGESWLKDWASVIPKTGGRYKVEDVATWLWRHFVGDGGKNYTDIERAHILSLLATDRDLNQLYCVQQRRIVEGVQSVGNGTPLQLLESDQPYNSVTQRRCDQGLDKVGDPTIDAEIALLEHGFSTEELKTPEMTAILNEMANRSLDLDSTDIVDRERANRHIGEAINFILITPFVLAQEAQ